MSVQSLWEFFGIQGTRQGPKMEETSIQRGLPRVGRRVSIEAQIIVRISINSYFFLKDRTLQGPRCALHFGAARRLVLPSRGAPGFGWRAARHHASQRKARKYMKNW